MMYDRSTLNQTIIAAEEVQIDIITLNSSHERRSASHTHPRYQSNLTAPIHHGSAQQRALVSLSLSPKHRSPYLFLPTAHVPK